MSGDCSFPRWRLIALDDGSLHARLRGVTASHLESCVACQQWLAEMHEVDAILRRALLDTSETGSRKHYTALGTNKGVSKDKSREVGTRWSRWAIPIVILVMVIFAGVFWRESLTAQSIQISDWLSLKPFTPYTRQGIPQSTPIPTPRPGHSDLPFGLLPNGEMPSGGEADAYRLYSNGEGFSILVGVNSVSNTYMQPATDEDDRQIINVDGEEVLIAYSRTEVGRSVISSDWISNDDVHFILVMKQPANGVTIEMVEVLVKAFFFQEATP